MARRRPPALDLQHLPPAVVTALETAMETGEIALTRAGSELGVLTFRSVRHEGTVLVPPPAPESGRSVPEGVTVVATAMELSEEARHRLSEQLGADYVVLDLHEAPPTADVLLAPPISPQLIGALRAQFPQARLLVTEIEDEELGVHYSGPVSRMLEAGASGYLPPRPVDELATTVHHHLPREERIALEGPGADRPGPEDGRALTG